MHFHHGIEGTVGDVGGIMKVMQPTTDRKKKLRYCNAMLSAENSLYLQTVLKKRSLWVRLKRTGLLKD